MGFPEHEPVSPRRVVRRGTQGAAPAEDALATEEPLEIRLRDGASEARPLLVTMRTPGHDEDLAVGLLFSEGIVEDVGEIIALARPAAASIDPDVAANVLEVTLSPRERELPERHGAMTSACGVCGRKSIESVLALPRPSHPAAHAPVRASLFASLPDALRREQAVFGRTGGLHAAGFFSAEGEALFVREDVGRHNATDKAIGALLRSGRPVPPVLLVSGRIGFEIAQKAARIGVSLLAAISAPTSLAVQLAEASGLGLVGFLRGGTFNVYAHPERIAGL